MKRAITLSIWFFILCYLIIHSTTSFGQSKQLKTLCKWMEGSFDSREQHLRDTANYFDIRLTMTRIWKQREDGFWLYVEQAVAGNENKPYRQRIYHVQETGEARFQSVIYTLSDPLRFAGRSPLIESLTIDSLQEKVGCAVDLVFDGKCFSGGTVGTACPSDRKGAKYATSEVTISKRMLLSWDRGYDEKGIQVWGAEKGGYRFIKK
ncbi:MAG: chromophore lyase CpcT/CpeT [Bacteroidota bacterium]